MKIKTKALFTFRHIMSGSNGLKDNMIAHKDGVLNHKRAWSGKVRNEKDSNKWPEEQNCTHTINNNHKIMKQ